MIRCASRRIVSLCGIVFLLVVASAACGAAGVSGGVVDPTDIDRDAHITVRQATMAPTIDPHLSTANSEMSWMTPVYDRLTTVDENMEVKPFLATSWHFADDGSYLEMQLRDDVTFNDGTPFDATAVGASIHRAKTLRYSTAADSLASITNVLAVDRYVVRFELVHGQGANLPAVFSTAVGCMISPKAIAAGQDLNAAPVNAGSGPYRLAEYTPGQRALFLRNDDHQYWDPNRGRAAQIEIKTITDAQKRLQALQTGEIQATIASGTLAANAQQLIDSQEMSGKSVPLATQNFLWLRASRPALADKNVRIAVTRAIDPQQIAAVSGPCEVNSQPLPASSWAHDPAFKNPYPYDPEAARDLIRRSGGSPSIEILYPAGYYDTQATAIQSMLTKVGIAATLKPMPFADSRATFGEGGMDSTVDTSVSAIDPSQFISNNVLGGYTHAADDPALPNPNPVTAMADAALDPTLTRPQRQQAYAALFQFAAEQAWYVPTCNGITVGIHANNIVGMEDSPFQMQAFIDVSVLAVARG